MSERTRPHQGGVRSGTTMDLYGMLTAGIPYVEERR
jgi:hypothetical protein